MYLSTFKYDRIRFKNRLKFFFELIIKIEISSLRCCTYIYKITIKKIYSVSNVRQLNIKNSSSYYGVSFGVNNKGDIKDSRGCREEISTPRVQSFHKFRRDTPLKNLQMNKRNRDEYLSLKIETSCYFYRSPLMKIYILLRLRGQVLSSFSIFSHSLSLSLFPPFSFSRHSRFFSEISILHGSFRDFSTLFPPPRPNESIFPASTTFPFPPPCTNNMPNAYSILKIHCVPAERKLL